MHGLWCSTRFDFMTTGRPSLQKRATEGMKCRLGYCNVFFLKVVYLLLWKHWTL